MKKVLLIAAAVTLVGAAVFIAFQKVSPGVASAGEDVSPQTAERLQSKVDAAKKASKTEGDRELETVEVSEVELESYVMFHLRNEIPARMDSIDVQVTTGAIA